MRVGSVVVASRSPSVVQRFSNALEMAGYNGNILIAYNDKDIDSALAVNEPDIFFLEVCFYNAATVRHIAEYIGKYPDLRIVCYDGYPYSARQIAYLIRAGALGYIDVRRRSQYLQKALKRVLAGEDVIPDGIEKVPLDLYITPKLKEGMRQIDVDIILLVAEELGVKEIAALLDKKAQTIYNRQNQLYESLGCHSQIGLVKYALRNGLVDRSSFCGCKNCHEQIKNEKLKMKNDIRE
jgi:DNA-binding NarL/FixJ family response regulator